MNNRGHWEIEPKVSNTPEDLWHNAVEYFKWSDMNPLKPKRTVLAGKEVGKKVEVELIRPYSVKALCLHCGITEEYYKDLLRSDKDTVAYMVAARIAMNIWVQIYELGLTGEISPVLADKLLALSKSDDGPQKVIIEHVGDLPKLGNSENEILKMIEIQNGEVQISKEKPE